MTGPQADWLRKNRNYRVVATVAGNAHYVNVGILHADGTFELTARDVQPRVTPGCFEVGVLAVLQR